MSRRIDIELTSDRGDGTWTWRAAGAKQPKGALDGTLLPSGAEVGQSLVAAVQHLTHPLEVLVHADRHHLDLQPELLELGRVRLAQRASQSDR